KILDSMMGEAENEVIEDLIWYHFGGYIKRRTTIQQHFINMLLSKRPNLIPQVINYVKNSHHPELLELQMKATKEIPVVYVNREVIIASVAEQIFETGETQSVIELLEYLYSNDRALLHSILPKISYELAYKYLEHKLSDESEKEILEKLFDIVLKDENLNAVLTSKYYNDTVAESLVYAANRLKYTEPIFELIRRADKASFWAIHKAVEALGESETSEISNIQEALRAKEKEIFLGKSLRE
ncbi:MAG: hypothetical protein ACP5GD_02750, partial [Candidatus Micrarchaeia archaeon]